jgi:1-deoxyxylulose-5-phosphate synthase
MEYRRLGRVGVKVSRICYGAGVRGELDEERFVRSLERAIELGCNFIDCGNTYGHRQSETLLGRTIKRKRDDLVITTKVSTPVGSGPNDRGLSRFHVMREAERSLRKLDTDRIDVYYMHHPDPETDPEETLRALEELVRQGKVRYVGASNHSGAQVVELLWTAQRLGAAPVVCLQNEYSLLRRRRVEEDLLPVVRRFGLGLVAYSPLAIGLLSGRLRRGEVPPPGGYWTRERLEAALVGRSEGVVATVVALARERGCTPAQLAIAWLLDHPELTAPISGADTPEYVEEVFGALEIRLSADERRRLDEVSAWEEGG